MASSKTKSKILHRARGVGTGGWISLDIRKLENLGWTVTTRESTQSGSLKTFFTFRNPQGKVVKSSKQVKEQLAQERILGDLLVEESQNENALTEQDGDPDVNPDVDYDPPIKRAKPNEQE